MRTDSARSISCSELRALGMPYVSLRSMVPVVLRSGTSGSHQLKRNATAAIGAATRNTVCSEWA